MGGSNSSVPPLADRERKVLLSYNIGEKQLKTLWHRFRELDVNLHGLWSLAEVYKLVGEPRMSIRAPILDRIFFMADAESTGSMTFIDFLMSVTSFCALSREEVLQLLFIIIDINRDGKCDKGELMEFLSYVPPAATVEGPLFPVNNKNALDKFKGGKWEYLEFDGLASLCESFPYIPFPAFHVQEEFRRALLGSSFWEKVDRDRIVEVGARKKVRYARLPGSNEVVEVSAPGRCTINEFLDYSKRRTRLTADGRRVANEAAEEASSFATMRRDEQIAMSPLANMIRNPRCMYHVPYKPLKAPWKLRPHEPQALLEMDDLMGEGPEEGLLHNQPEEQSSSDSDSDD
mmetsp:Transcript_13943/g.38073  ORF Transcript_13943/g.38073 Transcript_13943/m.38073 type:complete len:346 (+) Transcript_13943:74-1111(+)